MTMKEHQLHERAGQQVENPLETSMSKPREDDTILEQVFCCMTTNGHTQTHATDSA